MACAVWMRRLGCGFRGSKKRNPCLAESSDGLSRSIRKYRDIRYNLAEEGAACCATTKEQENVTGKEALAKDENQISAEADVNYLPKSKRSLAGNGRGV